MLDRIYPRVFVPFLAALLGASVAAWWIATSLLGRTLEGRLETQLTYAAEMLASGSIPLTDEVLSRFVGLQGAEFAVVDAQGQLRHASGGPRRDRSGSLVDPALAALGARSGGTVLGSEAGEPYMAVLRPLAFAADGEPGAVVAVASLAPARQAKAEAARWLGLATLLLAGVLAAAGHRVARGITRPVEELADMARRIAEGDREVRVHVSRPHEIGVLAEGLNDMTRRLAEFEQQSADQGRLAALGEMAARVAHEIRNPLTAIKMQVEMLGESQRDPDQVARCTRLLDEIRRLELIVTGTLLLSRPPRIVRGPGDLAALAREVCTLLAPQFGHRALQLECHLDAPVAVTMDADRIKQVVFNLLINAADALPDGGRVRISARSLADEVELAVEDSGPGIPEAARADLFHKVARGKIHGLGVGLMLCRELADLHGGTMEAGTSEALGGARLVLRLPRVEHPTPLHGSKENGPDSDR